jgi:hypothetical protein
MVSCRSWLSVLRRSYLRVAVVLNTMITLCADKRCETERESRRGWEWAVLIYASMIIITCWILWYALVGALSIKEHLADTKSNKHFNRIVYHRVFMWICFDFDTIKTIRQMSRWEYIQFCTTCLTESLNKISLAEVIWYYLQVQWHLSTYLIYSIWLLS